MKNIICKAFWGVGDRDWTIMVLFYTVHGDDELKAKKIVVLTILLNINS